MQAESGAWFRCLFPIPDALGWKGDRKALVEYLGAGVAMKDVVDFRNAMASLRFGSKSDRIALSAADARLFPCLFVDEKGAPYCVLSLNASGYFVYDGTAGAFSTIAAPSGRGLLVVFKPLSDDADSILSSSPDWLRFIVSRFKKYLGTALGFSFLLGAISLLYPLLIAALYSQMTIRGNERIVLKLGAGVAIFIVAETGFRSLRAYLLRYTSLRTGKILGEELFRRLMAFQASFTESASTEAQIRRMKDLRNVANFIAGQALSAIFDLPFVFIMLLWLVNAGGAVAIVPVLALIVFLGASLLAYPAMKKVQSAASAARSERMDKASWIIKGIEDISTAGMADHWRKEFIDSSVRSAFATHAEACASAAISVLSGFFVSGGGVATLYVGVLAVLSGTLRSTALVAAMMLVWRVLGIARSTFIILNQIDSLGNSLRQLQRFMALPQETRPVAFTVPHHLPEGALQFRDVSFRYGPEGYPALYGVTFTAEKGRITVLAGHLGAGKTTALKLSLALYRAQAGRILFGPFNIQQSEPGVLRRAFAYANEEPAVLWGTISDFVAGDSGLDRRRLIEAAERLGLNDLLAEAGLSFDTAIDETGPKLDEDLERLLVLMRAFCRKAPLYLVDEQDFKDPGRFRAPFIRELRRVAGTGAAVLVASNDPAVQAAADRIVRLESGRVSNITNRGSA